MQEFPLLHTVSSVTCAGPPPTLSGCGLTARCFFSCLRLGCLTWVLLFPCRAGRGVQTGKWERSRKEQKQRQGVLLSCSQLRERAGVTEPREVPGELMGATAPGRLERVRGRWRSCSRSLFHRLSLMGPDLPSAARTPLKARAPFGRLLGKQEHHPRTQRVL